MKKLSLIGLFIVCLISCNEKADDNANAYNAEKLAADYCDCMKSNKSLYEFENVQRLCDDKFINESRYYKLWNIRTTGQDLDKNISGHTWDSVTVFADRFLIYTSKNCCQETATCPD